VKKGFLEKLKVDAIVMAGFVLLLAYFLLVKITLYEGMSYSSDFFSHLQSSYTWFTEGSFLYETIYGATNAIHSYYTILLFSPLTILFFGHGLIVGVWLFSLVALICIWQIKQFSTIDKTSLSALLVSPVGFYLFDNQYYGFNIETLFLPLCVLWLCARLNNKGSLLVSVLIVLTKEDGIVLLWSLYAIELILKSDGSLLQLMRDKAWRKRFIKLTVVCFLGFIFSMMLLSQQAENLNGLTSNFNATSRIAKNFSMLAQHLANPEHFLLINGFAGHLIGLLFLLFFGLFSVARAKGKMYTGFFLVVIPIFIIQFYSSIHTDYRLLWAPRLSYLYGLMTVTCGFAMLQWSANENVSKRAELSKRIFFLYFNWVIAAGILIQSDRVLPWFTSSPRDSLTDEEQASLRCVSEKLPSHTFILVPCLLESQFHQHMTTYRFPNRDLVFGDYTYPYVKLLRPLRAIIHVDSKVFQSTYKSHDAQKLFPNFTRYTVGKVEYAFDPLLTSRVQGCFEKSM
jgi:hypothetical protein